jgi:hypothetical protein
MNQAPFTSKRWRRVEYERLVDIGVFEHEPLELIGGHLIVAEPQHSPHACTRAPASQTTGSSTSLIASSRSTGIPARI